MDVSETYHAIIVICILFDGTRKLDKLLNLLVCYFLKGNNILNY
jgi:hypothetical protein